LAGPGWSAAELRPHRLRSIRLPSCSCFFLDGFSETSGGQDAVHADSCPMGHGASARSAESTGFLSLNIPDASIVHLRWAAGASIRRYRMLSLLHRRINLREQADVIQIAHKQGKPSRTERFLDPNLRQFVDCQEDRHRRQVDNGADNRGNNYASQAH